MPSLPSQLIASAALQATQGNAGDVVDLTAAAGPDGFDCPLPGMDDAYASAACTCATGRSGPDSGRFQCDACLPGGVVQVDPPGLKPRLVIALEAWLEATK